MTGHDLPTVTAPDVIARRTELAALCGPQLTALTFPAPTDTEREAVAVFLARYQGGESA